jgi:hypothetical protein
VPVGVFLVARIPPDCRDLGAEEIPEEEDRERPWDRRRARLASQPPARDRSRSSFTQRKPKLGGCVLTSQLWSASDMPQGRSTTRRREVATSRRS